METALFEETMVSAISSTILVAIEAYALSRVLCLPFIFNHSALHFGSKAKMSKKEMT